MTHRSPRHWRSRALCLLFDPEIWFPIGSTGPARAQTIEAKTVCGVCPVQGPCLDWAVRKGESGIWGGTTEEERRADRRAEDADMCWTCVKPIQFCEFRVNHPTPTGPARQRQAVSA